MEGLSLHNKPLVKVNFAEIVQNLKVLHFDEFPILYIGTNIFGNIVLGSHLDDDDDTERIFCLHTILTNKQYYSFVNYKLSYLDILKQSKSICLVAKDFNFRIINVYDFDFESIPNEYLPLPDSFCPKSVEAYSLNFSLWLQGKLADVNKAVAEQVSKIQNGFTEFLEDRIAALKGFNLEPKALILPYERGSFKINFELELKQKGLKSSLFVPHAPVDKFITNYIKYLGEDFLQDKSLFSPDNSNTSSNLQDLENTLNDVYEIACVAKPEDLRKYLKEDIIKSASKFEQLTEEVGESFESLTISSLLKEEEKPISYIDYKISESFKNIVEEVEIAHKGLSIDPDFRDYKIYIYHLNTDTRSGNALIKNLDNEDEMSKPKIKIDGDVGLEKTKYTESLYLNKWISVKAKARKVGEKYKYLDISYEDA